MAATTIMMPLPSDLPSHSTGFLPHTDVDHQVHSIAQWWLSQFAKAAGDGDGELFASLFIEDGFWRDVLAFTSDLRSIRTANIAKAADAVFPRTEATGFVFAGVAPAIEHPYPDITFLTIHFDFQTQLGPAYGIARLVWDTDAWRAYTVFTMLEGIHGHAQRIGHNRQRGRHNDPLSYDERRAVEVEFKDSQPDVLIVGGGHNGLATAAQLKSLGVSALVIDKQKRVGDNWRLRYKSLSLHDPVNANHLPFIPFPPYWPTYTPAGKIANFLESYVEILELNVWLESTLDPNKTKFDEKVGRWNATVVRNKPNGEQEERTFSVKHIVLATGLGGGRPKMPAPFPGQKEWDGTAVHSSAHGSGADWKGKRALVVGACTSGHDIAVDFAQNGAEVTMLQRSPTFVMSVDKGQKAFVGGLYGEDGPPTPLADRLAESSPKYVAKLFHKRIWKALQLEDKELLDGLAKAGFKAWGGPEDSGFLMMALEKAGGYYFSTGGSEMIVKGDIKVKQGEIAAFHPGKQVEFKGGDEEHFDVVVFATGYTGFDDNIRDTVGESYVDVYNPVWGLDEEGEIRGVARETNIPNFFFIVGNLSACRITSKLLSLQILAQQLGRFPERYTYEKQRAAGDIVDKRTFKANGFHEEKKTLTNGH